MFYKQLVWRNEPQFHVGKFQIRFYAEIWARDRRSDNPLIGLIVPLNLFNFYLTKFNVHEHVAFMYNFSNIF